MKKVTKAQVKAMAKHNGHTDVKLFPSSCNPYNTVWVQGYELRVYKVASGFDTTLPNGEVYDFDTAVNHFEYYNCNAELGTRVHYYVSDEDFEYYQSVAKPRND